MRRNTALLAIVGLAVLLSCSRTVEVTLDGYVRDNTGAMQTADTVVWSGSMLENGRQASTEATGHYTLVGAMVDTGTIVVYASNTITHKKGQTASFTVDIPRDDKGTTMAPSPIHYVDIRFDP